MNEKQYPRRAVLKGALSGLAAIPVIALVGRADAAAAKLDPTDAQAKSLGYIPDVSKVDASNTLYKAGSKCSNCVQYQGKPTDAEGACNIFAGKLVAANGWCKVYGKKAG